MFKKNYWWLLVTIILAGLFLLTACDQAAAPAEETPVAEEATDSEEVITETELAEGVCPPVTVADSMGVEAGKYYAQYELVEFEGLADCELTFSENPAIAEFHEQLPHADKAEFAPVEERLPNEPLVMAPYEVIGSYGGVLNGLSNATEAGTSDMLSIRHVNLFRYADNLIDILPNVARDWEYNEDFTELTVFLRAGHKWSDGAPFTANDIAWWYNNLVLNPDVFEETPGRYLVAGNPLEVTATDDTTVVFTSPVPAPGLVSFYATSYIQPFQPQHFYEAQMEATGQTLAEVAAIYFRGSDWKDVPSPLLDGASDIIVPTLESHILIEETSEGRHLVANPYFHAVDTQGNQLPYISEIDEEYVPDAELRNLKITNGEVDYKTQNLFIDDFPLYKENEEDGNYTVYTEPTAGNTVFYSFNVNHKDEALREVFSDIRFREAASLAINREEINEVIYFGLGVPMQVTPADPNSVPYVTEDHKNYMIEYNPEAAIALLDEMGLEDVDGDGFRENLQGETMIVQIIYANQGGPVRNHELVQSYWEAVGINVEIKEVSSDEYREEGNNNNLDLTTWKADGITGAALANNPEVFVPPFGDFFNPGGGFEWATYLATDGAEGTEPPEDVYRLVELAQEYVQYPLGSEESTAIGQEIVDIHVNNLWKIGLVGDTQAPNIRSNNLQNFQPHTVITYDYYWSYPYRAVQWSLTE